MRTNKKDIKHQEDKLAVELRHRLGKDESTKLKEFTISKEYEGFTFRQLFIKLAFEFIMRDLELNKDFEIIYEYIKTFTKELTSVKIKIIDKTGFKSGHYWLLSIISKLLSLKTLKLYQTD